MSAVIRSNVNKHHNPAAQSSYTTGVASRYFHVRSGFALLHKSGEKNLYFELYVRFIFISEFK